MKKVIVFAPAMMLTALECTRGIAALSGIQLGIVSVDPARVFPDDIKAKAVAHYRVDNPFNADQIETGCRVIGEQLGGIDCLIGIHEDFQIVLGEVRDRLGIPGVGQSVAMNFRDKDRMKNVLREHGVPCAEHQLVRSADEARAFAHKVGLPLIAKPPTGMGSRGTFRLENDQHLEEYLRHSPPSAESPTQLEEFIQGHEHSFESLVRDGKTVWHSLTHYYPTPLEVLNNPWIQWAIVLPREVDHEAYTDIRAIAEKANQALGLQHGLSHMEWFRRQDGSIAISEVGARPPGAQMMKLNCYAHDVNFFEVWARFMVFGEFTPLERKYAGGTIFLRGMGKGRVKTIHGLEQAQQEIGNLVVHTELPQMGQSSSTGYEGEGWVMVRHPETDVVKHALKRMLDLIRVELG